MCRNIKPLFNFDPPVTAEEIRAASLQFVRKITGFNKPSKVNEPSFVAAVDEIAAISTSLLRSLESNAPAKNRQVEAAKAKARAASRAGYPSADLPALVSSNDHFHRVEFSSSHPLHYLGRFLQRARASDELTQQKLLF
jgi:hypothetical protein